jgi:hypothetical protein
LLSVVLFEVVCNKRLVFWCVAKTRFFRFFVRRTIMCRRLIYVMTFIFALGSTAQAAVYLWNGSAGDGLWETPLNWTVTDSLWTWPNEENVADPNMAVFINMDALVIDIINGEAITRGDGLRIRGADELTPAVLTLDNGSSLSVTGRLSVGKSSDGQPRPGELNVLGSTLTILAGDDGDDLNIADDANSVGTVNIVGSTVEVADQINIDEGTGTINITDSIITLYGHFTVGNNEGCVGTVNIDGASLIELGANDLEVGDGGEAHVTISGSTTINCDDLYLNEKPGDAAFLDVSGTATITTGDDVLVGEEGEGTATIGGAAVINVGDDIKVGEVDGSVGILNITGDATVSCPDEVYLGNTVGATGTLNLSGNGTFNVVDDIDVGDDSLGYCNISENATVNIDDTLYIATNAGAEGHVTISDNATVNIGGDLTVGDTAGNTATLHISGDPTISVADQFYMNDDDSDPPGVPSTSQMIMDGGMVTIGGYCTFNDDNSGTAEFIMNGGSFYCADYLNISDNLDGTAHLTMNGGEMITGNRLRLGKDGGEDTGQVRIFMNGGLLQAEELVIKITDTKIIYTGGEFRIRQPFQPDPNDPNSLWGLSEADMQDLIDNGTIVAEGAYNIVTDGDYTALVTKAASGPNPANGAEDVALDAILSWWPGFGAVSHDGYIGTSSPPPFIGNTSEVTFDPGVLGGLQPNTTYYWQLNAIEADGTIHTGDIWSFTTMDPSLVAYYALENDVLDGSGNGNDGTIVGAPTYVEGPAGYGTAMEFHGLAGVYGGGDYIDCGNDASLDIPGPISIALWIKPGADDPEGQGTETAPMAKAMSGISPWNWQVRYGWGSPQPYMAFTFNTSPRAWAYVGRNLERDEWCHIACSHDGATLKCYLDGVETDSTPMGEIAQGEAPVLIGSDGWGCDWIGAIDEVRIYNRALSEDEIGELAVVSAENLLLNPSFEEDEAILDDPDWVNWCTWNPAEGAGSNATIVDTESVDGARSLRIEPKGAENWHFIVLQDYIPLEVGKDYTASFWAKAEAARPLGAQMKATDNSISWGYTDFQLTTEWAEYTMTSQAENAVVKLEIFCAGVEVPFWLDLVSVYEAEVVPPGEIVNLLANGGFEDGVMDPWGFWGDQTAEVVTELVGAAVPEAPIEGSYCLHITTNSAGANNWDYGLNQGGHVFEAGKQYVVSAFLKCKEGTLDIRIKPERAASPWEGYGDQVFTMTDTWAEYHVTTPVFTENVDPASITFHTAFAPGEFWVDDVKWYEVN